MHPFVSINECNGNLWYPIIVWSLENRLTLTSLSTAKPVLISQGINAGHRPRQQLVFFLHFQRIKSNRPPGKRKGKGYNGVHQFGYENVPGSDIAEILRVS